MAPTLRHRVLRNIKKQIASASKPPPNSLPTSPSDAASSLQPGEMQLYSYYIPSLKAGLTYEIHANQSVTVSPNEQHTFGTDDASTPLQSFSVYAPRTALEQGDIHSVYPPPGHPVSGRILPHVVFTDPHLPWERFAQELPATVGQTAGVIPWLAVIAFEPSELQLTAAELGAGGLFPAGVNAVQSDTMAVGLTAGDAMHMAPGVQLPFSREANGPDAIDAATVLNMVFVDPGLAYALLGAEGQQGFTPTPNLEKYKYFAHVRQVNTAGMADAGVQDTGMFSVTVSHRTGPWDIQRPQTVIAHLVALDGMGNSNVVLPDPKDPKTAGSKIGLISLHSWTYTCIPPAGVDFVDTMAALGQQSQRTLRLPDDQINAVVGTLPSSTKPNILSAMKSRLAAGYTLLQHRLPTGEPTVSFYRSPLAAAPVTQIPQPEWPAQSNFGTDYQVLDGGVGVMDISYSAAWQLGKALGIADSTFRIALARIRGALYEAGQQAAESSVYQADNKHWTAADVVGTAAMAQIQDCLQKLSAGPDVKALDWTRRWKRSSELEDQTTAANRASRVNDQFTGSSLAQEMEKLASGKSSADPSPPYNEFNAPYSTDWAIIVKWLMDTLFLLNIPAHYLVPDPAFVPPESLRFFYIDPNWLDCLLDGALSLANHLDRDDDLIRQCIKTAFNTYLSTPCTGKLLPQTPSCGFFIRSKAVTAFPDLHISVTWPASITPPPGATDILRLERLSPDLLFVLLDRAPSDPALASITISQPAHQQCFSLGEALTAPPRTLEFAIKKVFTPDPTTGGWESFPPLKWIDGDATSPATQIYDWSSRVVLVNNMVRLMHDALGVEVTSALVGLQLNDPIYSLDIVNSNANKGAVKEWVQTVRELPVGGPSTDRGAPAKGSKDAGERSIKLHPSHPPR